MNTARKLIVNLWDDYRRTTPQAARIQQLLASKGETIVDDHIALRTYDDARVGIEVLARAFERVGYRAGDDYTFKEKKLNARHYEHGDARLPKVFISELQLGAFSDALRRTVTGLIDTVDVTTWERTDLPVIGRPWRVSAGQYDALAEESEYAAWVAALGFRANHFTVFVNSLKQFETLQDLNQFLIDSGFELNASGGLIKGSPAVYLEQSSTLADKIEVEFSDTKRTIPSCYYEFARRYPLPDGKLFQGFVAKSADKIFESTDRR